jgi:hypothetical protein
VQRAVDAVDPLAHELALAIELRLEIGDLADRVLVQQFLEAGLETRQVVGRETRQHCTILAGRRDARIGFLRLQRVIAAIGLHRLDDLLGEPAQLVILGVDPRLQPVAHVAFAVVAGFDRQGGRVRHLAEQCFEAREGLRARRRGDGGQQALAAGEQLARKATPFLGARPLRPILVERLLGCRDGAVQRGELAFQGAQHVGIRFEAPAFRHEPIDLRRQWPPVQIAEALEDGKLLQHAEPRLQRPVPILQFGDAARPAQRLAQGQHAPRYVRAPLPQRAQFRRQLVVLRSQLQEFDPAFGQGVLHLGLAVFGRAPLGGESAPVGDEALAVARRREADLARQPIVLLGAPLALQPFRLRLVDLLLEPLDPVAALRLDRLADLVALRALAVLLFAQGGNAQLEARDLFVEVIDPPAQQVRLVAGEPRP